MRIITALKRIYNGVFSTSAAGLYMILFAVAIGGATFIENDWGTSAAQKLIFKARWFELLLVLFGITLIVNIFRFRMIQQRKWAILMFHSAIIIILIGAGVTRYFGSEGMMHIREGSASNTYLSAENYLHFEVESNGKTYQFDEPVLFASKGDNTLQQTYQLGDKTIKVNVMEFIPNPTEIITDDPIRGIPVVKVVFGGMNGREEYPIRYGSSGTIRGTRFTFGSALEADAFNLNYRDNRLTFISNKPYTQMQMATQKRDTIVPGIEQPLMLRSLYAYGEESFVFSEFNAQGKVEIASSDQKMASNSMGGVVMKISQGEEEVIQTVFGSTGVEGRPRIFQLPGVSVSASYGAKRFSLPFSLYLRDFILERYPGTDNASSYASEVTLKDSRKQVERDQRIYMNNILTYDGYRFFQSSFDQDELGTYLSVNHDAPGTIISYIGYILLTLGMILTLFSSKSRFRKISEQLKRNRERSKVSAVTILLLTSLSFTAGIASNPTNIVNEQHAKKFGTLIVQDHNGRFKPINTLTSEVLRKLSRRENYEGLSSEQVVLGMAINPKDWYDTPLIKIGKHEKIRTILQTETDRVSYSDFFNLDGSYKFKDEVRMAYNKEPRDRGVYDKELLKLDEKVNICSMVFSGRFFKIFPLAGDTTHYWRSPAEVHQHQQGGGDAQFMSRFFPAYITTVQQAIASQDWNLANRLLEELSEYQQKNGGDVLPSSAKIRAELFLNKLNVFSRLGQLYTLLALAFLLLLFLSVFAPGINQTWPVRIAFSLLLFGFMMHTLGLGLRWYISGRAPWSNGYESMIYIGWTTVLAGLIFSRKSIGGLTATSALAATIMMVAGLSWLDPEITPLVPVLKSYWLTIHVSLEAGSYGFLMLGAIIGVLNLIFIIFANTRNQTRIYKMVKEMSLISEMTLIGGLFMISIGTYLGGVWANESWGRYWGWDAKETWALVTILVYSFILHMRFIPGLRGLYAFNVASLFGWATVIMTYFGVNYYLSGLHSYAAGDPVPIPSFVYYTVIALIIISLLAFWKHHKYGKNTLA